MIDAPCSVCLPGFIIVMLVFLTDSTSWHFFVLTSCIVTSTDQEFQLFHKIDRKRDCFPLQNLHCGSACHPASNPVGTRHSLHRGKVAGHDVDC